MEQAIKIAIENGYIYKCVNGFPKDECTCPDNTAEGDNVRYVLFASDPLFWQALGKGLGWREYGTHIFKSNNLLCSVCGDSIRRGTNQCLKNPHGDWEYKWHGLVTHLAEGKDINSFFEELIK